MQAVDQPGLVIFRGFGVGFGKTNELEGNRVLAIYNIFVNIDDKRIGVIGTAELLVHSDIVDGDVAGIVGTQKQLGPDDRLMFPWRNIEFHPELVLTARFRLFQCRRFPDPNPMAPLDRPPGRIHLGNGRRPPTFGLGVVEIRFPATGENDCFGF